MRLLPQLALCLLVLPACKIEPTDPGTDVDPAEPVAEDEFAARAAETLCAQLFACQCGDNLGTTQTEPLPWADEAACVAEKQPEYQEMLDEALMTGGTYSEKCGGELIADFERPDCQSAWAYFVSGGYYHDPQACPLAVVERQVGETCDPFSFINDCGEGKLCTYESFTCIEVGELPVAEGDSCFVGNVDLPCAPGLFCRGDGQGGATCLPPSELGDPCPDYSCFGADLTCDYDTLTCIANAGEGESCEQSSCAAGLYCDGGQGTICVAQYEYGHGCATDSVCAAGGQCINNVCTEPAPAVCYWL